MDNTGLACREDLTGLAQPPRGTTWDEVYARVGEAMWAPGKRSPVHLAVSVKCGVLLHGGSRES